MKIEHGKIIEEGDNHRVEKTSQHFTGSIASEWCRGLVKS